MCLFVCLSVRRLWEQREVDLQQEMNSLREVEASLNLSNSELSHRARTLQTQLELIQSKSSTTQKVKACCSICIVLPLTSEQIGLCWLQWSAAHRGRHCCHPY